MSGISGMGTTFNLPNYVGELFAITPDDTPLLSAIGGLTGGAMATDPEFEWERYDYRNPSQTTQVEGATAPTAVARARSNVRNVCEIHQSKVSVSYTKQSAISQVTAPSSSPYHTAYGVGGAGNPVTNELDWQIAQELKQIALDVNWSFINGAYNLPTDNTTARTTKGLLSAIATNATDHGTVVAGLSAATDTITETSTGRSNGDVVIFTSTGASTAVVAGRTYYVVSKSTNAFKVAATSGGSAITIGTATVAVKALGSSTVAVADVDTLCQQVFDNGGLTGGMGTFLVNSAQKRLLKTAYATAYGQLNTPIQGSIAGVSVETIETDFGRMNIMLDRHVPQDAIILLSLDQLTPVFLNVPDKGCFFEEPLAKTAASDDVQLYGEIGLAYGNELAHGYARGFKVA